MFSSASDKVQGTRRLDQVIWDPRGTDRFIVGGGTDVKMYEWAPDEGKIKLVTVQTDLQYMKALAWSPSPNFNDLVAVGLSTGRVELMRLNAGNATAAGRRNHVDASRTVSLSPKAQRSCHALAFSAVDPNYLAVGLDKVRNESSLIIFDVQHSSSSLGTSSPVPSSGSRPQPALNHRGTGSAFKGETPALQAYASAELVHSIAWVPYTHTSILAGMSQKSIRLYDLRDNITATGYSQFWNTKWSNGLCFDPFDSFLFASYGEDSRVCVWDRRKPVEPVLYLDDMDAREGSRPRTISALAWSPTHRGTLVSLARDSTALRIWNIATSDRVVEEKPLLDEGKRERPRSHSVASVASTADNSVSGSSGISSQNHLILISMKKSAMVSYPITSFAFVPHGSPNNSSPHVVTLGKEGRNIDVRPLTSFCQHIWGSRGHLAIGSECVLRILQPVESTDPVAHVPMVLGEAIRVTSPVVVNGNAARDNKDARRGITRTSSRTHLRPSMLSGRSDSPASVPQLSVSRSAASPTRDTDGTATPRPALRALPSTSTIAADPAPARRLTLASSQPQQVQHAHENQTTRKQSSSTMERVLTGDLSSTMLHRAKVGYGLENARDNANIIGEDADGDSEYLHDLWMWIEEHHSALIGESSPENIRMLGFDFSVHGVMGIWDGFDGAKSPSETPYSATEASQYPFPQRSESPYDAHRGDFDEAISRLVSLSRLDNKQMTHLAPTKHKNRRLLALSLSGWCLSDEELFRSMHNWEETGQHAKAACWSLFTHNVDRAVDILMRSGDEQSRAFSAAVAGFDDQRDKDPDRIIDPRTQRWRDQCEKLIVRTQDPYLRTLLQYMVTDGWLDVLDEQSLPLKDRLGIAFMFLHDDQISSWLHRLSRRKGSKGHIDALLITGLTAPGLDLLQAYVDFHGDVQTAAILGTLASPSLRSDARIDRWVEAYHDLLDRWKLFHERCQFDIERGRMIQDAIEQHQLESYEWTERQIMVRCHFCAKIINPDAPPSIPQPGKEERPLVNFCPSCRNKLPNCSICLVPVGMPSDFVRDAGLRMDDQLRDTLDIGMVFCMTCRHGGHAAHILDWFHGTGRTDGKGHEVCAVADCTCRCADQT
ncbi:WD40 repeat-like protein [Dacryopinax primogenitus]|uniref:WD40 repeat-like protein n=1 Tax=Dacryopinax primogenitus (strain DJM 731) TaxID=1858805 RepID=M5GD82_DACPD|nr:WD40 repeat-like protein [Dacryopinax primogenitus]EJU04337.1 WD40 repeat-like protein [Dacryopinax primogenitus]